MPHASGATAVIIRRPCTVRACHGLLWLALGLMGATGRIVNSCPTVIVGIVLGLGLSFMLEGIKDDAVRWLISAIAFRER